MTTRKERATRREREARRERELEWTGMSDVRGGLDGIGQLDVRM